MNFSPHIVSISFVAVQLRKKSFISSSCLENPNVTHCKILNKHQYLGVIYIKEYKITINRKNPLKCIT